MKSRRLFRIASRPRQSATPRLHTASSAKQSKPLPKVLSSISFHIASSQAGGAVFVKLKMVIAFSRGRFEAGSRAASEQGRGRCREEARSAGFPGRLRLEGSLRAI